MVRALARERLDDIADPFRKLSQDLLRFLSSRRPVHERLAAYSRVNNGSDNRCDFKTVNRQTTNRVLDAPREPSCSVLGCHFAAYRLSATADARCASIENYLEKFSFRTSYGRTSWRGTESWGIMLL